MKIAVVGAGYVGLSTAVVAAERGHEVVVVDVDASRVASLREGVVPFHEPGLADALAARSVAFETRPEIVRHVRLALVAVPTPADPVEGNDPSALVAAVHAIATVADHPDSNLEGVFVRSSVPPATLRRHVLPLFASADRRGKRVVVASLPEFLREGTALADQRFPDRVVVGADDEAAFTLARELYAGVEVPFLAMSLESAELAKLATNALLATCISFANELATIAEATGADVGEALAAVHGDRRLGGSSAVDLVRYLAPGPGYGGSCLVKDLDALLARARESGAAAPLLDAVRAVNASQADRVLARIAGALGGIRGRRIAVLGLGFKGGSADVRGSVAIGLVRALAERGAHVRVHDPRAVDAFAVAAGVSSLEATSDLADALDGADGVILLNDEPVYRESLPNRLSAGVVIADTRAVLEGCELPESVRRFVPGVRAPWEAPT